MALSRQLCTIEGYGVQEIYLWYQRSVVQPIFMATFAKLDERFEHWRAVL